MEKKNPRIFLEKKLFNIKTIEQPTEQPEEQPAAANAKTKQF